MILGLAKRILILVFLLYSSMFFPSCEDQYSECTEDDYADCNTIEPNEAEIVVYVTINEENRKVLLTIYDGKIDDNKIIAYDTAYEEEHFYWLRLGNYYSVTAKYKSGDKVIYAVDGNEMYKESRRLCDSTCWDIEGGIYDLKLKYD